MSQGLDRGDRKLLIGAGFLLVVLVVISTLISPPRITGTTEIPSSYSPSWNGAKGAFLLLQDLGFDVSRWEHPPTELSVDAADRVLILADPTLAPTEEERLAISEFIQNGGRVVASGALASQFLPLASKFEAGDSFEDRQSFDALIPSPLVRDAPQISMLPPVNWQPKSMQELVIYGNEDTAAVETYKFGKGQVIWWADSTPLTNGGVREIGNLAFFLNCMGSPSRVHVLWDEYFHGERGSLLSFFARTPLLWALGQLGLIFLAILATHSRRFGPVYLPQAQSRLSPLEFIDTLGDLYNSAHVSSFAVKIAYQRFHFMLTRNLGLPLNVGAAELAGSARRNLGWEEAPFFQLLSQCEVAIKGGDLPKEEPLKLVQQLHDYAHRLEVRRTDAIQRSPNE